MRVDSKFVCNGKMYYRSIKYIVFTKTLLKRDLALKKVLYGIGGLSYSVISQTMSNFFMFFATSVLGLSGSLVGVAIAISTIWDGISDTFVGYLSDTKPLGRLGKRNGYMLIACIGMSIVNIFVWFVPGNTSIVLKFVWILVSLILLKTFNTMFSTPYMALGNELATSDNDRTKINADDKNADGHQLCCSAE